MQFIRTLTASILQASLIIVASDLKDNITAEKDGKVFSLFTIVQFINSPCRSNMALSGTINTGFRNGTCFTTEECGEKQGSASGTCAGGFGVCCVFMITSCGGTVTQNCSYIKNPNFPSPYTDTTACRYTVNKCAVNVCDLRLDFEMFSTSGPSATSEAAGGACVDMLTVTVPTGQMVPVICGTNNGQHIYLDIGRMTTDTATLNFAFTGVFNRFYDVKITQIPCNSRNSPPNNCLQYHTGVSGKFETFNFEGNNQHLASTNQVVCIRQEKGFCCIDYQVCSEENSMNLDNGASVIFATGKIGSSCSKDYIVIEASSSTGTNSLQSRYCGGKLTDVSGGKVNTVIRDCTRPFQVTFITDNMMEGVASTLKNRGSCLKYNQVPCS
nr:uncharacterized protein LOC121123088 [Lepeophtheirus salmonis]